MRTSFFAVVCAVAWCVPARAQMEVDSITNDINMVRSIAQQAQAYALQAQQYVAEAQSLGQLVAQYNAWVQNPSLGGAVGIMSGAGLGNDLPLNPASLMSLTSGYSMSLSGLSAQLSALSSLSNNYYDQTHVYTCTDASFACTQEQQRGYGLAGSSGIAQSAYQDLRTHMPVVQALRTQAATATTPAQRENVALALQSETAWNNNLTAQIAAAQMQANADQNSLAQQDNEKLSQALDQTYNEIP